MNDEIPLEAPPVDDEGVQEPTTAPQAPAPSGGQPAARRSAGKNSNNLPPIGDIELKKKSGTYNTYTIRLSYGQIECIRQALEKDHATPVADELKSLFDYYLQTLPGPGEEEEDIKAREEMAATGGQPAEGGDEDSMIPMPPGEEDDGQVTVAGEGPEGEGDGIDPNDLGEPPDRGDRPMGQNLYQPGSEEGLPGGEEDQFNPDDRIPPPPGE